MNKPTIPEVLPVIREYQRQPGNAVGGDFHIVLDEGNISDSDVAYCLHRAREAKDELGVRLGELLLRMTKTQRSKLSNMFYTTPKEGGDA